jgi:hypothetical protein
MAKRKTPAQAHKEAETKLNTLKLQTEAKLMEQQLALLESPQPVVAPWYEYPAYDTWGMSGSVYERPYIWTQPDDKTEGRYRPLYENAQDVRRITAEARSMCELFPVAKGLLRKLSDYIIGNGWDFIVQPKNDYENDPTAISLAALVQKSVDKILNYNNFVGGLDRQLHERSRIDGNAFPALYPEGDCVRIEPVDYSYVLEPEEKKQLERYVGTSHKLNGWWHGVHTLWNPILKRDDVCRPLGYHAVFDNLGEQWDYLPIWRVEHIKRNVENIARVGVSDFLTVQQDLQNEAKLRRNTALGAAILAAIVGIRQHAEGTTQSTVESMVSGSATGSYQKPIDGGSRTQYQQNVAPGTVKDIPKGMEWLAGPMGTLNQPVYIEVDQFLLRLIGSLWSMPEFLTSGDASNANYASTLVAESPFVKYCEAEQAGYAAHFERLVWKAVHMLSKMNKLGANIQQVTQLLEINAEYTSPASRDKLQQAQTNQLNIEMGIMSKRTAANDAGLDYDEEEANIALEPKPVPEPVVQMPFGGRFGESEEEKPEPIIESPAPAPIVVQRELPFHVRAMDLLMGGSG